MPRLVCSLDRWLPLVLFMMTSAKGRYRGPSCPPTIIDRQPIIDRSGAWIIDRSGDWIIDRSNSGAWIIDRSGDWIIDRSNA